MISEGQAAVQLRGLAEDYNWRCAFEYAGTPYGGYDGTEPGATHGRTQDPAAGKGYTGKVGPVSISDVKRIVACSEGERDERAWMGLFELHSGAFLTLVASCDYTGWDCQASGSSELFDTEADAIRWGLGDDERERLGLAKVEET